MWQTHKLFPNAPGGRKIAFRGTVKPETAANNQKNGARTTEAIWRLRGKKRKSEVADLKNRKKDDTWIKRKRGVGVILVGSKDQMTSIQNFIGVRPDPVYEVQKVIVVQIKELCSQTGLDRMLKRENRLLEKDIIQTAEKYFKSDRFIRMEIPWFCRNIFYQKEIQSVLQSYQHMYTALIVQYKKDKLRLQIVTGKLISKFETQIEGARRELTEELGVSVPIELFGECVLTENVAMFFPLLSDNVDLEFVNIVKKNGLKWKRAQNRAKETALEKFVKKRIEKRFEIHESGAILSFDGISHCSEWKNIKKIIGSLDIQYVIIGGDKTYYETDAKYIVMPLNGKFPKKWLTGDSLQIPGALGINKKRTQLYAKDFQSAVQMATIVFEDLS